MTSEILPGVNSGNSRIWKVQRFLAKQPKGAVKLVMMATKTASEASPLQLREWERDEVVPELAAEILAQLDEYASEAGGTVQCTLTYESDKGRALGTHLLNRQANHVDDPLDGAEVTARMLQGDAQSQVVHATASSLALQRIYMSGIVSVMGFNERAAERAENQNVELRRALARAEAERDAARSEVAQLEAAVAAVTDDPDSVSPAQQQALQFLNQMAPLLMARLMGAPAAPAQA